MSIRPPPILVALNVTCAVIHAEMPVSGEGIPEPRGMQLWVDLPKQYKMVEPSYQELGPDQYALVQNLSPLCC